MIESETWTFRIIVRYVILQLAGLLAVALILYVINIFIEIEQWISIGIIIVWVIKDIILFPLVWRSYDWDRNKSEDSMIGAEGVATEPIAPTGYIMVRGELWKAQNMKKDKTIERGQKVLVHDVNGLLLYVKPAAVIGDSELE
jgi:membrane-bound ClpP family serine protease